MRLFNSLRGWLPQLHKKSHQRNAMVTKQYESLAGAKLLSTKSLKRSHLDR